jgi:hypothetical protein
MVMAIKVSQATIDKIKKMGMTAALKSAPKANAEMTEALRRMYGQRRLDAAKGPVNRKANAPSAISNTLKRSAPGAISGRTPVKKSSAPGAISGKMPVKVTKSNAPSAISGKKVSTTSAKKPTPKPQTTWKNTGTDPFSRAVFGAARSITSGQGAQRMTAAQVAAENKRRADKAKANKNK